MKLEASKRQVGKANALRNQGLLPAIVYSKTVNQAVTVSLKEFDRVFRKQGQSGIIDLDVEGEVIEVLVKQVQMNKRKRVAQHADFYAITRGQTVEVAIPVAFQGTAVGVRNGGQLDIKRREIVIRVLPRLIPENIKIDLSNLNIGEVIHISDAVDELPEGAEFADNPELTIVTIVPTRLTRSAAASAESEED